jgi:hypothetical protein
MSSVSSIHPVRLKGGHVRNSLIIRMFAAAALVIVSATAYGQATDPWIGVWKGNLTKSTFSPGPTPKTAATVTIESAPGGSIKTTIDGADAQGKPIRTETVGAFDGKDNGVKGAPAPNTTTALKRIDARTFEAQGRSAASRLSRPAS